MFNFLGIPGRRVFFKFDTGKVWKSLLLWMVGFELTTQNPHGLSTTPFVNSEVLLIVRLTTCKRLTNSLPKLGRITRIGFIHQS